MAITTRIYKNYYNRWCGHTEIDLHVDDRVLTISTSKSNGLLKTYATVGTREGAFISHTCYSDYRKTWVAMNPKRVTEKAVTQQHNEVVIDMISSIIADVKKFYKEKELA